MFNSKDNPNNQRITDIQHTATRDFSGGSMLQSISHPQANANDGTEFFRAAPSLGDVVMPAETSGGNSLSVPKESAEKDFSQMEVKTFTLENEKAFFRPAEIFINSTDLISESESESKNSLFCGNVKDYAQFKKQRLQLAELLNYAALLVSDLDMDKFTEKLRKLSNKVECEDFKIQIVGTFKNGKSTFINSFLGEDVLPAYALPCTAVINEVKYGEKKRAILHFKNPVSDTLPKELSKEALAHMEKYHMKNIPPMEIPYDDIENYVVIPMGKDPKEMLLESPYEKVELFWPLELLKNGVEIIDSPGLNEHATRTKVTMDYISKADAVIFVLNATALCTMEEMNFIEHNLKAQGFTDLFFVINRFDMIPEKEKERMANFARKKLSKLTSFGDEGIFFTSAKNALDAKKQSDSEKLVDSGMPDFEKSLSEFLTKSRGSSKLYLTAQKLNKLLREEILEKIIPRRKQMLETSVDELNEKHQSIIPKLKILETKKDLLYKKILYSIDQCKVDFKQLAQQHMTNTIASVPDWVNDFTPPSKLGMIPSNSKAKQILDEITTHLAQQIEIRNRLWQDRVLFPAMNTTAEFIFKSAEKEIRLLADEVSSAATSISSANISNDFQAQSPNYSYNSSSTLTYENLQVSKDVTMQVACETLLVMLSFINPAALVGLFTAMFVGAQKPDSGIVKKLKEAVISEVTHSLSSTTYDFIDSIADNVSSTYVGMVNKLLDPINYEISEVQNQIEAAIADMEKGEESAKHKKSVLDENEVKIKSICIALENFSASIKRCDE